MSHFIAMKRPTSSQMPAASAPYATNTAGFASQPTVVALLSTKPCSARSTIIEKNANTAMPRITSRRSKPKRGLSLQNSTTGNAAMRSVAIVRQTSVDTLTIQIP